MSSNSVEYVIRLQDLASSKLAQIAEANNKADNSFKKTQRSANGFMRSITFAGMAYGALSVGKSILSMGNDFRSAQVAMTVFTGSAEIANKHIKDLRDLAGSTPLETGDLIESSKVMQQFGISVNSVIPLQKAIGDATGGNAEKFKQMTLAFSQMSSAGKLQGQDLLQMINAGFNPLMEISKRTGVSMGDLRKQMEKGAISSEMIAESFAFATSEGGQFFGMMDKQSETLAGKWSSFSDRIKESGLKLFESSEGGLKKLLDIANQVLGWFEANWSKIGEMFKPIGEAIAPIIDAFGYFLQQLGFTGTAGNMLSKVFNAIGTVLNVLSPILKVIGWLVGRIIIGIANMVSGIMEAIKLVTDLFGLTSKVKFNAPTVAKKAEFQDLQGYMKTDEGKKQFSTGSILSKQKDQEAKAKNALNARTSSSNIKNITVNIGSLVDGLTVKVMEAKEIAPRIKEEITKYLLTAVNDVNVIGG